MRTIARIILPIVLLLALSSFAWAQQAPAEARPADQRLVVFEAFMRPG